MDLPRNGKTTVRGESLPEPVLRAPLSFRFVKRFVAWHFGLEAEDLEGQSLQRQTCIARQIAIWLCSRHFPKASLQRLSQQFGRRDHTTARHSIHKVRKAFELKNEDGRMARAISDRLDVAIAEYAAWTEMQRDATQPARKGKAAELGVLGAAE